MTDIDAVNSRILSVLEKDGRISNIDLASRVGLSASACLRRVQELERSGVIKGYRAVIDRAAIGGSITIFVKSVTTSQALLNIYFESRFKTLPPIKNFMPMFLAVSRRLAVLLRIYVWGPPRMSAASFKFCT